MKNELLVLSSSFTLHETDVEKGVAYLFNVDSGIIHRLNKTAYDIVSAFNGHDSIANIINTIASMYDVNESELTDDFSNVVAFCKSIGALVPIENTQEGGDLNEEEV